MTDCRDSMVPKSPTSLRLQDLSGEDLYTFNSMNHVEIDVKTAGEYAASDLVLELQHFFDDDTLERVELEVIGERIKK